MKYGGRVQLFPFPERQWPNRVLETAPVLFSTDLRDGNQSLPNPMTFEQKLSLYKLLVSIGFKEIEVAYPCANQVEFDFVRYLIETPGLIPDDVLIQVITPCRDETIKKAVESVRGAKQAIILTYLPSSDNFRNTVLNISEDEWVERARRGAAYARSITKESDDPTVRNTRWTFNFAFEDFANARMEAIIRCTEAIRAEWNPSREEKMIICVPSSMEASTPNIFADQVEYLSRNISHRDTIRLTVHTHNDRGGAVASAELASLAGADRIEGCLFGNGERAGNMDLVVFALNLLTQGIDPGIDLSRLDEIRKVCEDITGIPVHPRTPYSGAYYLKAFSGTHQDAISKGIQLRTLAAKKAGPSAVWPAWRVPYLPLDPTDIGRSFEDVVGINSQSGKGGVAHVIKLGLGLDLPPRLAHVFSKAVKDWSIRLDRVLSSEEVCTAFLREYQVQSAAERSTDDVIQTVLHAGNTLVADLGQLFDLPSLSATITSHNLIDGFASYAASYAAYAEVSPEESKPSLWGVGLGASLQQAKLCAVMSALCVGGYMQDALPDRFAQPKPIIEGGLSFPKEGYVGSD
ncbi:2-isopropylmalate synthase [Pyrenophora tritici-repentis]|nr:2-isopropylmalate synthase [Pyrenophora tritici-repentis]